MLLRYGAQPDKKEYKGRTALWWNKYAYKRHDRQSTDPIDNYGGVGVDIEYNYSDYPSQLSHILWQIGEILKRRKDVDPNPKDNAGLEPEDPSLLEMNFLEGNT